MKLVYVGQAKVKKSNCKYIPYHCRFCCSRTASIVIAHNMRHLPFYSLKLSHSCASSGLSIELNFHSCAHRLPVSIAVSYHSLENDIASSPCLYVFLLSSPNISATNTLLVTSQPTLQIYAALAFLFVRLGAGDTFGVCASAPPARNLLNEPEKSMFCALYYGTR